VDVERVPAVSADVRREAWEGGGSRNEAVYLTTTHWARAAVKVSQERRPAIAFGVCQEKVGACEEALPIFADENDADEPRGVARRDTHSDFSHHVIDGDYFPHGIEILHWGKEERGCVSGSERKKKERV
jgi:hypothetical protein